MSVRDDGVVMMNERDFGGGDGMEKMLGEDIKSWFSVFPFFVSIPPPFLFLFFSPLRRFNFFTSKFISFFFGWVLLVED